MMQKVRANLVEQTWAGHRFDRLGVGKLAAGLVG